MGESNLSQDGDNMNYKTKKKYLRLAGLLANLGDENDTKLFSATSSGASRPWDAVKYEHRSKADKEAAGEKAKKQQDADLSFVGSQFHQDSQAYQPSNPTDYPQTINLD
ncbi:hypothetical protein F5Y10DRAFT_261218 [Nemania abortiva]|nr:hypothetical protein F5Y10DRAFT_261218 [Nemania abortiva]